MALNKSDINEKAGNKTDAEKLSGILGCPVIRTVSTSAEGLSQVVAAACSAAGKKQTAPFRQADIDLTDKKAVEAEDRRRYRRRYCGYRIFTACNGDVFSYCIA